jgi:RNA polymerase sigma-70 factor (ECF subfamily)
VVTRLSIDRLRSARREGYIGPWLPEPLISDRAEELAAHDELDESLSMAFLVLLESLNPVERAVFLLREVFDYDYEEISSIVRKSEANCRQIGGWWPRLGRRQDLRNSMSSFAVTASSVSMSSPAPLS